MARPAEIKDAKCVNMRLPGTLVTSVDRWRGTQPDVPNRSEAIRRLVESGLKNSASPEGR